MGARRDVEPDPKVLKVLRQLGYSNFQVRYRKVHAKRNRDHIMIKLNKNGISRTDKPNSVSAHQDLNSKLPPYHRSDFSEQEKLVKEFWTTWKKEIERNG